MSGKPTAQMPSAPMRRAAGPVAGGSRPAGLLLRRRPALLGVTLLLILTAAVLVSQTAQGRVPFGSGGELRDFKSILSHVFMLSYLPPAYLAVVAGARPLGSWVASAVVQHYIERAIALR